MTRLGYTRTLLEGRGTEVFFEIAQADRVATESVGRQRQRDSPAQRFEPDLKTSDSSFFRVLGNNLTKGGGRQTNVAALKSVVADNLRPDIVTGNGQLVGIGVTRQCDDVHTVPEGVRDLFFHVCGDHNQCFGQIERHAEVVIQETAVSCGVERLEHRRQQVFAELMNVVDEKKGISHAGLSEPIENLTWSCLCRAARLWRARAWSSRRTCAPREIRADDRARLRGRDVAC